MYIKFQIEDSEVPCKISDTRSCQVKLECALFLQPFVYKGKLQSSMLLLKEWCYSAGTAIYWQTMRMQPWFALAFHSTLSSSSGALTRLRCDSFSSPSSKRRSVFSHPVFKAFYYLCHFFGFVFHILFQRANPFKHLNRLPGVAVKAIVLPAVIRCLFLISKCKWRQYVKSLSMSVLNKCFVQIYPGIIFHGLLMCWSNWKETGVNTGSGCERLACAKEASKRAGLAVF